MDLHDVVIVVLIRLFLLTEPRVVRPKGLSRRRMQMWFITLKYPQTGSNNSLCRLPFVRQFHWIEFYPVSWSSPETAFNPIAQGSQIDSDIKSTTTEKFRSITMSQDGKRVNRDARIFSHIKWGIFYGWLLFPFGRYYFHSCRRFSIFSAFIFMSLPIWYYCNQFIQLLHKKINLKHKPRLINCFVQFLVGGKSAFQFTFSIWRCLRQRAAAVLVALSTIVNGTASANLRFGATHPKWPLLLLLLLPKQPRQERRPQQCASFVTFRPVAR